MALTPAEVRHIADLARLELADDEAIELADELTDILSHMENLEGVDVTGVEAVVRALGQAPLRPDEPGPDPLDRPPSETAPAWDAGFFTVPRLEALDADAASEGGDS